MREKIKELVRKKRMRRGKERKVGWWNKECKEKKKEVRKRLRRWRKGKGSEEDYKKGKREYKELCEKRKEEKREELMREAREAKTQEQVWRMINKERNRRVEINKEVGIEEWDGYFRALLREEEERIGGKEKKRKEEEEEERGDARGEGLEERRMEEEEIKGSEIRRVIRELKMRKAAGEDGVQNEAWKWAGRGLREELRKVCNRVWEGEGLPEGWKEGIIVPIAKKRWPREVGEHRGVTLMVTAYKIYAAVLAEKLRREVEDKKIIPEWQAEFRKGRGVMDNIYVLNLTT